NHPLRSKARQPSCVRRIACRLKDRGPKEENQYADGDDPDIETSANRGRLRDPLRASLRLRWNPSPYKERKTKGAENNHSRRTREDGTIGARYRTGEKEARNLRSVHTRGG